MTAVTAHDTAGTHGRMVEHLVGDHRHAHISNATDSDLLLAAIAVTSSALHWPVMKRAKVLAELYMAASDETAAEQIAALATEDDNTDWYFLFLVGDRNGGSHRASFSISTVVAALAHTERGRAAMRVVARTTMARVGTSWIDGTVKGLIVPLLPYADLWTLELVAQNANASVAADAQAVLGETVPLDAASRNGIRIL